ncbi:MAG: hypothetical protein IJY09_03335 [Lachnospiraceae bacterium]|nr:hypothetical protein [Lachnospiraceae bacterium]
MTEELNNFCTDMKDLFMKQDFEAMEKALAERTPAEIAEMAERERGIIAKYYEEEKFELLLTHLNFVAFASFLYEYAGKRGVYVGKEYQDGMEIFVKIFELCQQVKANQ